MHERPTNRLAIHKGFNWGEDTYEIKKRENREVYDTIILDDSLDNLLGEQDKEITFTVRLLAPEDRRTKYCFGRLMPGSAGNRKNIKIFCLCDPSVDCSSRTVGP